MVFNPISNSFGLNSRILPLGLNNFIGVFTPVAGVGLFKDIKREFFSMPDFERDIKKAYSGHGSEYPDEITYCAIHGREAYRRGVFLKCGQTNGYKFKLEYTKSRIGERKFRLNIYI